MLEAFVKYIVGELGAIAKAPAVFALAVIVSGLIIWRLMEWGYGRENSLLRLQPAEQKAILETLRKVIGAEWAPLTDAEIARLADALRPLPKRRVQMMYENALGSALALTLRTAFQQAGWEILYFGRGGGLDAGFAVGSGAGLPALVKASFEKTTALTPNLIRPHEPEDARSTFIVSVGIKDR